VKRRQNERGVLGVQGLPRGSRAFLGSRLTAVATVRPVLAARIDCVGEVLKNPVQIRYQQSRRFNLVIAKPVEHFFQASNPKTLLSPVFGFLETRSQNDFLGNSWRRTDREWKSLFRGVLSFNGHR
jgi:hypothetical protein